MVTIEQAKDNLLKDVKTPKGTLILYGINLLPDDGIHESRGFGLIFYISGEQQIFWNTDCTI